MANKVNKKHHVNDVLVVAFAVTVVFALLLVLVKDKRATTMATQKNEVLSPAQMMKELRATVDDGGQKEMEMVDNELKDW